LITHEKQAQILRLYHAEKWPVGTIACELGLHHTVVTRVLERAGLPAPAASRPSIIDGFLPFVLETLNKYPRLAASRLYRMVRERGYPGGPSHFRELIRRHRPGPPATAYLRLKTLPGEQAQADWAHFGKLAIGRALRPLVAFVMVLSYSRAVFLRFFPGLSLAYFLRGHQEAFLAWGGSPRVILYDNLKSAVLERSGDAIRFHPTLVDFSAHWRYEARPVAVARGNEKGRVERAVRFVRTSFFAARSWKDLADLNRQAERWAWSEAMERRWPEDAARTVREAFEEERGRLLEPPPDPFPAEERREVAVGKTPYVRFDLNDYSVPHGLVRRVLVVVADGQTVRILNGNEVVATHPRSYDKGQQIEDPRHVERLVEEKRQARKHRGMNRLSHAAPSSARLLEVLAERGGGLGGAVARLLGLLESYGAGELEEAITEALARGTPHPHAVRHILERRRQEDGRPPPLPLALPDDPRVRDLNVRPHSLDSYDTFQERTRGNNDEDANGGAAER
jgi:transposase